MSGQLAYAGDEASVHEAHLLAPEHGNETLHVAVQEIEKAGLLATLLQRYEAADRRAIDERYLNGHGAIRHLGRRITIRRRGLDASHLRFRDEENFLFVEKE